MNRHHHVPFAPLASVLAVMEVDREPCLDSPKLIGRLLGVHARQVHRWRADGLTLRHVDQVCHRIGRHPSEIWSDDDFRLEQAGAA